MDALSLFPASPLARSPQNKQQRRSKVFVSGTREFTQMTREVLDTWNQLAAQCMRVQSVMYVPFGGKRARHLEARLNEREFTKRFSAVCEAIRTNPFLRGDKGKFVVTFDWLIGNSERWPGILEGSYDEHEDLSKSNRVDGQPFKQTRNRVLTPDERMARLKAVGREVSAPGGKDIEGDPL